MLSTQKPQVERSARGKSFGDDNTREQNPLSLDHLPNPKGSDFQAEPSFTLPFRFAYLRTGGTILLISNASAESSRALLRDRGISRRRPPQPGSHPLSGRLNPLTALAQQQKPNNKVSQSRECRTKK